jgi:SPP1 gp7 family putative phage head morphogenesis protein
VSTPARLYKNAIDLNRYSNSVARRVINSYNDIIIDAVNQLRTIDELAAPVKAARLRSILAQLKESLDGWAGDSTEITATELQGIAELQSQFVTDELRKALPAGVTRSAVNTVEISPQFAQSVVTTDPTQINVVALSDDLFKSVYGADALARQAGTGAFSLTAARGATITLPNGRTVEKSFRGIAVDQAERFGQVVRQGLLTGETTPNIAKRLIGSLQFSQEPTMISKTLAKIIAEGGQSTAVTDSQVVALIRTSINQVANTASQQVYEANQDITQKYRYVATLDTRTSAICRALDGREFEYGKGPMPPQHFNCRSTTVPVINYKELGFNPPPPARRASMDGQVPADTTYGKWLKDKMPGETEADVIRRQQDALGDKAPYFRNLANKYGPDAAIAKLVKDDGSELTLAQLRKRYGPVD